MTTDPDELKMEIAQRAKDPIRMLQSIEWTVNEMYYSVKGVKLVGWVIATLLLLILLRLLK